MRRRTLDIGLILITYLCVLDSTSKTPGKQLLFSVVCYYTGCLVMTAVWNRAGHYIFMLWFLYSIFFLAYISAVGDWMSTILAHMVWP